MMPMHVTSEESLNSTTQVYATGALAAVKAVRLTAKATVKTAKWTGRFIAKHHTKPGTTAEELIKDACSAYRGGFVKNANDPEVSSMVNDLAGDGSEKLDGRFFFTGDRTDLSYFWRRADKNSACVMPKTLIEDIDDPELKSKVTSTLTKARMDGYIIPTQDAYVITPKGEKLIYDTNFITDRLKKEVGILSDAGEQLEKDRINATLKARGIDPAKYDGYDRATVNKRMLKIGETDTGDVKYYVPGTKRKLTVEIPKKDTIDIDGQTEGIFLDPKKDYKVAENGGQSRMIKGDELFRHYDNKNERITAEDIDTAFRNPESVSAENSVISPAIEDVDDTDYYTVNGDKLTERDGKYILSDEHNGLVTETEFDKQNVRFDDNKAIIRVNSEDTFNTSKNGFTNAADGKMRIDSIGVKGNIGSAGGKKLTDGAKQFTEASSKKAAKTAEKTAEKVTEKAVKKTEKVAEKVVVTTSKTVEKTTQAAAKAVDAAGTAVDVAANAVDAAGTAVGAVASAIPPIGIISSMLKVICKAAAVTAKVGAKAAKVGAKAAKVGAKTVGAGAKTAEVAVKTKNLEQKL